MPLDAQTSKAGCSVPDVMLQGDVAPTAKPEHRTTWQALG